MTRFFLTCILVLTASGCALLTKPVKVAPGVDNPKAWQAHQTKLDTLQRWSLQGRAATGKLLGWSGNLNWQQNGAQFDVRLSGPIGTGGFRAQGNLSLVKIRTKDKTFYTNRPNRLVTRLLGWSFPLQGLRFWALGLPYPGQPAAVAVDNNGLLKQLVQQGWRISYESYQRVDDMHLPKKIVLTDGSNIIKLVVDRWFDLHTRAKTAPDKPSAQ